MTDYILNLIINREDEPNPKAISAIQQTTNL